MNSTTATSTHTQPKLGLAELVALKTRQQAAWSSGDYALIGATLQIIAEDLCEAVDIRAGQRVLDVATGSGNAALAAARRFCSVVATDYVPSLLERGRERSAAEQLPIEFCEGDAEAQPFPNDSFDVVLSTLGVMFTPDQERAAAELVRVCKPGGKIGLACWTPDGFVGQLFRSIGKHLPPPAFAKSPALWGTRARIDELFSGHARAIHTEQQHFAFRYRSNEHMLDVFKMYYGPVLKAFAALAPGAQVELRSDILALIERFNRATDGTAVVPSEYLVAVITRR